MTDKSAIYELRMAGMSEQDAINEAEFIARKQRTIDALVAALEVCRAFFNDLKLDEADVGEFLEIIDAALALAQREG